MGTNLDLIRATYEGSSSEANGRNLLAALAPEAAWTEAEGLQGHRQVYACRLRALYQVSDGKILSMTQYVDTAMVQKALEPC